jgi:hypothetical protein
MVSRKWPIARFIQYVSRLTLYGSTANACIIRKSQRLTALEDRRDRSEKLEPSAFRDDIRFSKKKAPLRCCEWGFIVSQDVFMAAQSTIMHR